MKNILNRKVNSGITLIALVITIVVLIILATVILNITVGEQGLINRAKIAKESYQNAEDFEQLEITKTTNELDDGDSADDGHGGMTETKPGEYVKYTYDTEDGLLNPETHPMAENVKYDTVHS